MKNAPEEDKAALEQALGDAAAALERARDTLDEPVFAPP